MDLRANWDIVDAVEEQLAKPLGMKDWDISLQEKDRNSTISKYLAFPIWFSTRDMARIGQLMLNKGEWNKGQIISEHWVDEMLRHRTTSEEIDNNDPHFKDLDVSLGYGYMWWLFEDMDVPAFNNAYTALGYPGQAIVVFPEKDIVPANKTKEIYQRCNSFPVRMALITKAVASLDPN